MPINVKLRAGVAGVAEIEIYDPIGQDWFGNGVTAKKFRDDLKALGNISEIVLRINSPGGEVFDGFAIYNALKEHAARIVVHIDGLAASIASVIAMAGDEIIMGEGAMMMIHDPWTIALGDADDMRKVAEMLDKVGEGLIDAYVTRTKQSRAVVDEWMKAETWFTADEAIEHGFADKRNRTEDTPAADAGIALIKLPAALFTREGFHAFAMSRVSKPPQIDAGSPKSASADAITPEGETTMPNPASPSAVPADPTLAAAEAAAREAAKNAEKDRRAAIRTRFGRHATDYRDLLDACLDDPDCTVDAASAKLLAKLGEGAEPLRPSTVIVTADARDRFREGAVKALLARCGHGQREPGNEFNGMQLADIAARALILAGVNVTGMSRDAIARKVLASQTTSDFPQLLSNTAGKVLRAAYDNFPNTWNKWAAAGEVSDFKVHPRIQIGAFNGLDTIAEGGEYSYGSLAEDYENAQASTKGKAIALSRQMIVNDDLGGFNRRAQLMGRAAARSINSGAYAYLTSGSSNHGPTSTDTGQYFNATAVTTAGGHANLTSSGTAISVASLGVGRTAMRKQKDKSLRETLNIQPAVLVTPVGKEDLAKQIITSESDPASSNSRTANIYRNAFEVVSDPYLDGISATAWYLFANPLDTAGFEVVFLDGNQAPFLDEAVDFDTDTMKFKVRLDYGFAIGDWRAAYKNVGA